MSDPELRTAVLVGMGLLAAWAAVAIALAAFVVRRHNWARFCLIASAVTSGLLSLTGVTLVLPLVPAAAAGLTVWWLLRADVADWFSRRG